jgi:NAD(P)-dependent dehydrogenase (short-subunit alcohol dehydrogenase family)
MTKAALVTGASKGIGAAVARLAATRGYDVTVNYRSDRAGAEAVAREVEAAGRRAHVVEADAGELAGIERIFAEHDRAFGRLDLLVNNAGTTGPASRLEAADPAMIAGIMQLNATALIWACREAIPRMSTRHGKPGGAIVNISSRAPKIGSPGEYTWYAASKGAVDAFTLGLARELAEEGVRVNAVAPGLIATNIHAAGGQPDRLERFTPLIPMKRPGTAEEVAETVLFLGSDAASYVTGAVLDVGGGR